MYLGTPAASRYRGATKRLTVQGDGMAYARITYQWPDSDAATVLEVGTEADGPDALDECVARVSDLWRECVEPTP